MCSFGNFSPLNSSCKSSWKEKAPPGWFWGCSVPTKGSGWGSILPLVLPSSPCVIPQGPSLFPGKGSSFFQPLQHCQVILSPPRLTNSALKSQSRLQKEGGNELLPFIVEVSCEGVVWKRAEFGYFGYSQGFSFALEGVCPSVGPSTVAEGRRTPQSAQPAGQE